MRKTTHYARSCALPAIAAALALSSTPLLAQDAQPVTEPIPQVTPPPPTMDATPAPEATPADDTATTASEPATATTTTTVKRTTRSTAAKAVAKPAPALKASVQAPARPAPTASGASTTPAAATEPVVAPAVDSTAPAPATAQVAPAPQNESDVPVITGGALALLALGGGAFAIARRRRQEDDDIWVDDEIMADESVEAAEPVQHEPVAEPVYDEQPKIVAPATSAFTWGNTQGTEPAMQSPSSDSNAVPDDDRLPGESWVDRAYRGPTPTNPSASLRNRLKRAAFFDKREREVAAGTADPVDMDAGLPDTMVGERERELA